MYFRAYYLIFTANELLNHPKVGLNKSVSSQDPTFIFKNILDKNKTD